MIVSEECDSNGQTVYIKSLDSETEKAFYMSRITVPTASAFMFLQKNLKEEFGSTKENWHFGPKKNKLRKLRQAERKKSINLVENRTLFSDFEINVYVSTELVNSPDEIDLFLKKHMLYYKMADGSEEV